MKIIPPFYRLRKKPDNTQKNLKLNSFFLQQFKKKNIVIAFVSLVYFPINQKKYKKEERDIATAITNIAFFPDNPKYVFPTIVCYISCNWTDCPKHNVQYRRKGFNSKYIQICFQYRYNNTTVQESFMFTGHTFSTSNTGGTYVFPFFLIMLDWCD